MSKLFANLFAGTESMFSGAFVDEGPLPKDARIGEWDFEGANTIRAVNAQAE